jgi:RNA exonuclease 1
MMHPYVIDTSIIFNLSGERFRKTKLRVLAAEFLSENIQSAGDMGHDPREDASAALKLVQKKLQHSEASFLIYIFYVLMNLVYHKLK